MAPLMILALVAALAVLAMVILIAVIVGIRSEPRRQMATGARGPLAAVVRCMLGVYVALPTDVDAPEDNREECSQVTPPTGGTTAEWTDDPSAEVAVHVIPVSSGRSAEVEQ